MPRSYRRRFAALILPVWLSALAVSAALPAVAATPASPADGLSGTWRVSRTCLTICASPKPVRKVVLHLSGDVFTTGGPVIQKLYRIGNQVLVHGPKDSLLLTIETPGLLMHGRGVGADGSTFETTWRCVAPAAAVPTVTAITVTASLRGSGAAVPLGINGAPSRRAPLSISRC